MKVFSKPKVLVCVLTGSTNWVNPQLAQNLITMAQDTRFAVQVEMVMDKFPVDYARNCCVVLARERKADWLLMVDHDQSFWPEFSPLDAINNGVRKDVIGLPSMQVSLQGFETGELFVPNIRTLERPETDGEFFTVKQVGTGAMLLSHRVWEKIPGPWFKFGYKDGELHETNVGEDFYFCNLALQNNLKVWAHNRVIPHWKTIEVAKLGMHLQTLRQMAAQGGGPMPAKVEWGKR